MAATKPAVRSSSPEREIAMTRGMVAAAQAEAVEAGGEVLAGGGNAADAAVAAALVQTVVDPQMCGIAGMGSMQVPLAAPRRVSSVM